MKEKVVNVVVAGLGGQGVITASDLLAHAAFHAGHVVKKAEVHGMSRRGGSVATDVRYGPAVFSPMVPRGEADWLVLTQADQLEPNRPALRENGGVIGPEDLPADLAAKAKKGLNVALMGLLSTKLGLAEADWLAALDEVLPEKIREMNRALFLEARAAGLASSPSGR